MAIKFLPHFRPLYTEADNIVCFSGRGSGKSYHVGASCIWYARRVKVRILYLRDFASTNDQSTKAQLEIIIADMGMTNEWIITRGEITHKRTGSIIFFRGLARNPDCVKSIPNIDICVYEECENASAESVNILRPTIRKARSRIIWVGNPRNRTNAVAQLFLENEPPPNTIIINNSYLDNIFCSEKTIREAEDVKKKNIHLYNHIYLGQYLDVGQCILVPSVNHIAKTPHTTNDVCVVGADIARKGGDQTVLCVRRGKHILEIQRYDQMDLDALVQALQGIIYRHKPDIINIDSTGHGAWAGDGLKLAGIKVNCINFSSSARDESTYTNKRTELYGLALDYFEAGGSIPQDKDLVDQLMASYYTLDRQNRYALIGKDEIRTLIGSSPDVSDSFVLSLHTNDGKMFSKPTLHTDAMLHTERKIIANANWRK